MHKLIRLRRRPAGMAPDVFHAAWLAEARAALDTVRGLAGYVQNHCLAGGYRKGDPVNINIPPGEHTIVLTTYADAAATALLGVACLQTTLKPGEQFCETLEVHTPPDGAATVPMDMTCSGTNCPCTVSPDTCIDGTYCEPVTQRCVPGCKTNSDCVGKGSGVFVGGAQEMEGKALGALGAYAGELFEFVDEPGHGLGVAGHGLRI